MLIVGAETARHLFGERFGAKAGLAVGLMLTRMDERPARMQEMLHDGQIDQTLFDKMHQTFIVGRYGCAGGPASDAGSA